ncbi:MAG: hydrogenase-4 component G [Campylobacteraceae bacterium]|nr:hydrogenase-4 component G [Campylobacteraceae bacterium]
MKIDNSFASKTYQDISVNFSKKLDKKEKLNAQDITDSYVVKYQMQISLYFKDESTKQSDIFTLSDIGYNGKPIGDLTQDEAKGLVAKDGFFGIKKTSDRIANFVISGAGDDIAMLKAGREGILKGFDEAQKLWGGKLPEISQKTMKSTLGMIDARLKELGGTIVNTTA